MIHPTAHIDKTARVASNVTVCHFSNVQGEVELSEGVFIGPYTALGSPSPFDPAGSADRSIRIGHGTRIGAGVSITGPAELSAGVAIGDHVTLRGPLRIGPGCQIFEGAVIGNPGQFPGRHEFHGEINIGANAVLRESVYVNKPVTTPVTSIGDNSYLMARTQIDHDCRLGHHVKTGSGVTLGGSVRVDDHAYLGMNAVIHQGTQVGAYAMIGMNGVVMKHVPPYAVLINRRFTKINRRGLSPAGATEEMLLAIERWYADLVASGRPPSADDPPWLPAIREFYDSHDLQTIVSPPPEFVVR